MIVEGAKQSYEINLIVPSENPEENIKSIICALSRLQLISNNIFSCIKNDLNSKKEKIKGFSSRIDQVDKIVSSLETSNTVIKLTSSNEYPCEKEEELTSRLSEKMPELSVMGGSSVHEDLSRWMRTESPAEEKIRHLTVTDVAVVDKVRWRNKVNGVKKADVLEIFERKLPKKSLHTLESFYVFNSFRNAYMRTPHSSAKSSASDFKAVAKKKDPSSDDDTTLHEARDHASNSDEEPFFYLPVVAEVPVIDIPESLPNLPGVAENVDLFENTYRKDHAVIESTPKNPVTSVEFQHFDDNIHQTKVEENVKEYSIKESNGSKNKAIIEKPISQDQIDACASGPPPPPPPPLPPPVIIASPPPPPPPPLDVTSEHSKTVPDQSDTKVGRSSGGDDRSNLMAAIRAAGGSGKAKLRPISERKIQKLEEDSRSSNQASSGGGDLMADLESALAMRRKGISGTKLGQQPSSSSKSSSGLMNSLVSAIPTLDDSYDEINDSEDDDWDIP